MDERDGVAETLTPADVATIVSVVNGNGVCRSQIGAATMDLEQKRLTLFQFMDNDAGHELDQLMGRLRPKLCLIPNTAGAESCQYACSFRMPAEVLPVDRHKFDDVSGREMVLQHCSGSAHVLRADIADQQYSLVAAGALFSFVSEFAPLTPHSLTLVVCGSDNSVVMDMDTVRHLEVFHSAAGSHRDSLFSFLNRTRTAAGCRFLRSSLFAPSTSRSELTARQDCVQELLLQQDLSDAVADFFQQLQVDLDTVTARLSQVPRGETSALLETQIDSVVLLKHCISLLPKLVARLHQCESDLMRRFSAALSRPQYAAMLLAVQRFLSDDITMHCGELNFKNAKVFALRADLQPELELQRSVYCETVEELNQIADTLNKQFEYAGSLKLVNNLNRGYHLELSLARVQERPLDRIFVARVYEGKSVKFTTHEIIQQNSVLSYVMNKIIAVSHEALRPLITFLTDTEQMEAIYDLKDVVAYLDFLQSLAVVAKENQMKRPVFADHTQMRECANPIFAHLAKLSPGRVAVTNDFHMSTAAPLMLITGPNMSGKSGFLRQVALLQIMAQIGSFLPAKDNPQIRIVDRILTRIGCDDDLVTSCSSFMAEVAQVQYLLSKVTCNSLVIIDELGRGTSDEDGVAICAAVCEALLREKAFSLFATHYHDLVRLQNLYPFISSYQMDYSQKTTPDGGEYADFTFKLKRRPLDDNAVAAVPHGIQLAERLNSLPAVAAVARELLTRIELYRKDLAIQVTDLKRQLLLALQLYKMSRQADRSVTTKLGEYLQTMKHKLQALNNEP